MTSRKFSPTGPARAMAIAAAGVLAISAASGAPALAQQGDATAATARESAPAMKFADLADLAVAAPVVAVVDVRKASRVDPARTGPVKPGWARVYVEADTRTLLYGDSALGARLKYLADVKLEADGKMPKLRKQTMIVFARPVDQRVDELQLVAPDAQVPLAFAGEERVRALLAEIHAAEVAPPIVGVRDAYHTQGNLAGEGETQIFLRTANGDPASISVVRSPNAPPRWGLSIGELVNADAVPPARNTLAWYRLACGLPAQLPAAAQMASDPALRQAAAQDYAMVVRELGPCVRERAY